MPLDQAPHQIERPAIHREAPQQANFQPHELLQDFHKIVGSKKAGVGGDAPAGSEKPGHEPDSGQERKPGKLPNHLVMTDAFAGTQGALETRGLKPKGPEDSKLHHDGKHVKDAPAKKDASKEAKDPAKEAQEAQKRIADTTTIVGKPKNFDPGKPTIAFVDDFKYGTAQAIVGKSPDTKTPDGKTVPGLAKEQPILNHGEVSARAAEAQGFNVYRVQSNAGANDTGDLMQSIDQKIKSGELPLGKGDAVNLSVGPYDSKVSTNTAKFGVPSTSANLAENKDKLLDAIKAKSADPSNPDLQREAKDITQSNAAIKDIQSQGIEVLTAAGNSGADTYTPQFLSATEINSTKPNGVLDSWSSDHSGTLRGDGVMPITTQPQSPFSQTSLYNDRGNYRINLSNGNSMDVPMTKPGQGYMGGDKLPFDRNNFDPYNFNPTPTPNEAPTAALNGQRMGGDGKLIPPGQPLNPDFNKGLLHSSEKDVANPHITDLKTRVDKNVTFADQPNPDDSRNVMGAMVGTSFSNTTEFPKEKEELERRHREGR